LGSSEIRTLLAERYGALYSNPVVKVVLKVHVNITGAVRTPGQFFVPPSATLVDALALAGGITSDVDVSLQGGASDPSRVRLVRDGVGTVIDLRPLQISMEVVRLQVQSGDWLYVPRAPRSQHQRGYHLLGECIQRPLHTGVSYRSDFPVDYRRTRVGPSTASG